ncbi:MAG: hypothetical protein ACREB7_20550, partial [Sphingopyxis sp.]|uniref:hypothetical protein n=1 Tax=Sphingopyxis sp. TaxID=1908224 RepID=UPI003D6C968D
MSNALEPTVAKRRLIDQRQTYAANFGLIFRSASVFYAISGKNRSTTISFMNYWAVKRAIDVSIVVTTRTMNGKVIERVLYNWESSSVVNHKVDLGAHNEGSIEIEIFSAQNLVIPYPAIMAVYETAVGISMVHSYARIYSPMEVEEGNSIEDGSESCASVRDAENVRSFVVMHNGYEPAPAQVIFACLTNSRGEKIQREHTLPALPPYGTARLDTGAIFPEIRNFLAGEPGNLAVKFRLSRAFARLLVANETIDGKDLQVTHSNFNYTDIQTNILDEHNSATVCLAAIPDRDLYT